MAVKYEGDNIVDWDWEGAEGAAVETDNAPLVDEKTGKPIVMRVFDFQLPPLTEEQIPTKEQILAVHKSKVLAFLWRDELVPIHEFKVIFSKDKQHFRIFVACQAKANSVILDAPVDLSDYLHGTRN